MLLISRNMNLRPVWFNLILYDLSTKPRKNKSWFNQKCADAIKNKKHMLRNAKKIPKCKKK